MRQLWKRWLRKRAVQPRNARSRDGGDGTQPLHEALRREVAQRESAEHRLNESEQRFRLLVEHAPEAIVVLDAETGRLVDANPRARQLFGSDELVLRQLRLLDFSPPVQLHGVQPEEWLAENLEAAVAGNTPCFEWVLRNTWGEEILCEIRLLRLPAEGRVCIRGSITDITERKRSEESRRQREQQFRQSQKLEAVGALAGGVAHEFNNLLQVILGYTDFAIDALPSENPVRQDLQQVRHAAHRAAILTCQLLSFSRQQEITRELLDPAEVVRDLIVMLRPLIGEQIEVSAELAADVQQVFADRTALQQMLMNLCVNARDAMPDGGRLQIRTKNVMVRQGSGNARPGAYVLISVSDSGVGMTRQQQERIFDPFYTTKETGKGTGLGLAMVYGMVQQHQGIIRVFSEVGVGTTFKVYLPVHEEAAEDVVEDALEGAAGGQETVLVAEDEPLVCNVVTRILEDAGYTVILARDGEEAVRLFEEEQGRIDLLLLDVVMPKMSGRAAYQIIKSLAGDMKVIFCSGYDPETSCEDFFHKEGLPLVDKPFDPVNLLRTIREVLDDVPRLTA